MITAIEAERFPHRPTPDPIPFSTAPAFAYMQTHQVQAEKSQKKDYTGKL